MTNKQKIYQNGSGKAIKTETVLHTLYSQLPTLMVVSAKTFIPPLDLYKIKKTAKKVKSGKLLKKTKSNIVKLLTMPVDGIEKVINKPSLKKHFFKEEEEKEIQESIKSKQETEAEVKVVEPEPEPKKESKEVHYGAQEATPLPLKSVRKIYSTVVSYGKNGYTMIEKKAKKVSGRVRYTVRKYANTSLFIKSTLNPGWDFAPSSALDLDTNHNVIAHKDSIDDKNARYEFGFQYLKYKI